MDGGWMGNGEWMMDDGWMVGGWGMDGEWRVDDG